MKIDIGSQIKVVCVGNIFEAGTLIEHTDKQMVIELVDKSLTIIQNPNNNVIAIKVSKQETESRPVTRVAVDTELEPPKYERRQDLRAASLAELHKLRALEERKRARELMTNFELNKLPEVNFGYPSFKSISKHPKKKTR